MYHRKRLSRVNEENGSTTTTLRFSSLHEWNTIHRIHSTQKHFMPSKSTSRVKYSPTSQRPPHYQENGSMYKQTLTVFLFLHACFWYLVSIAIVVLGWKLKNSVAVAYIIPCYSSYNAVVKDDKKRIQRWIGYWLYPFSRPHSQDGPFSVRSHFSVYWLLFPAVGSIYDAHA